jgi:hypothetical protein
VDVLLGEAQATLAQDASSGKTGANNNNGPHRDDITLLLAKRP